MKRLTKAALGAGAAVLLLAGGGATGAFWVASGNAGGQSLVSGTLSASGYSCNGWTYTTPTADAGNAVTSAGIVPGDTVQAVCSVTVTGSGDHLDVEAEITVNGTVVPSSATVGSDTVTISTANAITTANGATANSDGSINMSASTGPVTLSVTVTVAYPYGSAGDAGPTTSATVVDLSTAAITVTQLDPSTVS
ncbi:MAG: alternate-type signal peptide domain-containing protein [Promicromonosporaceae bacterium]|nr:alternate-type signal peptide domain-containing protein [Promicromonosporaceae bacterium]